MIGKFFQKYWKLAIALTVSLIVILGISYSISGFKEFTNALVAWGTLMLAFATFMLIRHSSEQEKKRRKEALLTEINDWVTVAYRLLSGYLPTQAGSDRRDSIKILSEVTAKTSGMTMKAKEFGQDFSLLVNISVAYLDAFNDWLHEPFNNKALAEKLKKLNIAHVNQIQSECADSFLKLLGEVSKLKTKLF